MKDPRTKLGTQSEFRSLVGKGVLVSLGVLGALETLAGTGTVIVVFGEIVHWWDWL